jgi:hypothetical protein
MKKIIFWLSMHCICLQAFAQDPLQFYPNNPTIAKNKQFDLVNFEVNDSTYAVIYGAAAHSPISFYTTLQGGNLLLATEANSLGYVKTAFASNNSAALVTALGLLNTNKVQVNHFINKEFILNQIQMEHANGKTKISWQAIAQAEINFYIIKTKNTPTENIVTTKLVKQQPPNSYLYEEAFEENCSYQIEVLKSSTNIIRYTSPVLHQTTENNFLVYPSPTTCNLNVALNNSFSGGIFKIFNMAGTQLITGYIDGQNIKPISVVELPIGLYLFSINGNTQTFIKQ